MVNVNSNYNEMSCTNCKKKIEYGNKFCTYCGNIIVNNISIDNQKNKSIHIDNSNMDDEKNNQDINKKYSQKNGLITSIISVILFILFFVQYACFFVIAPIIEYGFAFGSGISILGGGFVGFFILFPTLVSIILGIISINRYKKSVQKKSIFRKILNILNIISLITIIATIIFLFVLILFLCIMDL